MACIVEKRGCGNPCVSNFNPPVLAASFVPPIESRNTAGLIHAPYRSCCVMASINEWVARNRTPEYVGRLDAALPVI